MPSWVRDAFGHVGCPLMRVVTWNIELGRNIGQAAADIQALEPLRSPDVLLVQEMAPESVAELADRLNLDYRYAAPATHSKTSTLFGNAVLSPWPMHSASETVLPHTAMVMGQLRSVASAVVEVDGTNVAAHSVHLETVLLSIRRRVAQVEKLAVGANQQVLPTVIGGDFNSGSSRSLRRFDRPLESAGFHRATDESMRSFRRFGRSFALDHLYIRGLTAVDVGVSVHATASDHQPIWAELAVSQHEAPID